jgi:hypothetical protein
VFINRRSRKARPRGKEISSMGPSELTEKRKERKIVGENPLRVCRLNQAFVAERPRPGGRIGAVGLTSGRANPCDPHQLTASGLNSPPPFDARSIVQPDPNHRRGGEKGSSSRRPGFGNVENTDWPM